MLKNPLSVMQGKNEEVFERILLFYAPPPKVVLDVTAGHRIFWRKLSNTTLDGKDYTLIFGDIRKILRNHLVFDLTHLPIKSHSIDVVVFDPPFTFDKRVYERRENLNIMERYSYLNYQAFLTMLENANYEFLRVLSENGMVIAKIQDTHHEGRFYTNHITLIEKFTNFFLQDLIVYRYMKSELFWRYKGRSNKVHSYFLIFKKNLDEGTLKDRKIIHARYYDHVLFQNANPQIYKPTIRKAVGFLEYENDLFLRLIVDVPCEKLPFEKPNQTSGLVILKKNIIEMKQIE